MPAKSTYDPKFATQAAVACRLGAIDKDLQELFGVCERTLQNWRRKHPEFLEATKEGKDVANTAVKEALYKRAVGCITWKEAISKHGDIVRLEQLNAPDTAACMSWLNNRCPDEWSRAPELRKAKTDTDSNVYNITIVKPDDVANTTD